MINSTKLDIAAIINYYTNFVWMTKFKGGTKSPIEIGY